ncbi:bacterial Ig-like domain-containing protein [Enterococcus faecalis]|uniref:bacterial Ig-like domain-containing protein n=1 Tax=Enterococcus faecalis TaxID=1351 RepID=UPI0009C0B24E|nr:bacterial Ig-like domain-containing protein [Enterococcus faecalis]
MNKILLSLMVSFLCITQGGIAFSESETVNNSSAPTTITAEHGIKPFPMMQEPVLILRGITVMKDADLFLTDLFSIVTDENGNPISVERLSYVVINGKGYSPAVNFKKLNTDSVGTYTVGIVYDHNHFSNEVEVNITPRIDKTKIVLKDVTLFVGEKWDPKRAFVEAYEAWGKSISWETVLKDYRGQVYINDWPFTTVDTSKPGEYTMKVTMKGYKKIIDSNTVKISVKQHEPTLKTKDSTIYLGTKWDPKDNFVSATDKEGKNVPFSRISYNAGSLDEYKPGVYKVEYSFLEGNEYITSEANVTVKPYKLTLKTKDSTIYVGTEWDPKDNFVSATNEFGDSISWGNSRLTTNIKKLDTSAPLVQPIQYIYKGKFETVKNVVMITVKEDQTKAKLKDDELYVGEKWELGRVFKNVVDKDGKPIKPEKVERVWIDGQENVREVDTSKPGKHTVMMAIKNAQGEWLYSNKVTITVKEDQAKAKLKDDELYVGEKWELGRVFENVVDKDGKPIKPEEVKWLWINGQENVREIDTSKPGKHKVYIAILNAKNKWIYSNEVIVTVKEESFTIKKVPNFDFEDNILVSTNKSVVNKKENPVIELETPSIVGKDWQLQVELSPFLDKKNKKNILKGVSLFIPKGKLESDLETEEPTQYDCQLEANGKASILMHGTKTKGKGRWRNKLETKGITLSVPSENKTGNYESTLHWTLLDVPG